MAANLRDLVDAVTPLQARLAYDQLDGTLTAQIAGIDKTLFDLAARLVAERHGNGKAKAQRVAVKPSARGHGVGRALMTALEEEARRRGFAEVILGAQLSAVSFYLPLGYEAYGDVFDDAGIPHRMMKKRV